MGKKRAIANDGVTNNQRYELFKSLFSHLNQCIEKGFYIEAIALEESFIADRLESRINFLQPINEFSFKPLEKLISKIKEIESDEEIKSFVISEITNWKNGRNYAVHELAKIQINENTTWNDRLKRCKESANSGKEILRTLDKLIQNTKK